MSVNLSKYQIDVSKILQKREQIEKAQADRKFGGQELSWMHLKDGESAMVRLIPRVTGELSKEVHRYKYLDQCKFISPKFHANIDDPFFEIRKFLEENCRGWRSKFSDTFGKESEAYKAIEDYTKNIWSDAGKLRESVEHYVLVIHYTAFGPQGLDRDVDLRSFEGPKIMRLSEETFLKVLGIMSSPMYANPAITDFEQGRRLYIKRTGSEKDTVYDITPEPIISSFPKDEKGNIREDILEACPDLDIVFKPDSIDELKSYLVSKGYYELCKVFMTKAEEVYNKCLVAFKGGVAPTAAATLPMPSVEKKVESPVAQHQAAIQQAPPVTQASPPVAQPNVPPTLVKPTSYTPATETPAPVPPIPPTPVVTPPTVVAPTPPPTPVVTSPVNPSVPETTPKASESFDDFLKKLDSDIQALGPVKS